MKNLYSTFEAILFLGSGLFFLFHLTSRLNNAREVTYSAVSVLPAPIQMKREIKLRCVQTWLKVWQSMVSQRSIIGKESNFKQFTKFSLLLPFAYSWVSTPGSFLVIVRMPWIESTLASARQMIYLLHYLAVPDSQSLCPQMINSPHFHFSAWWRCFYR